MRIGATGWKWAGVLLAGLVLVAITRLPRSEESGPQQNETANPVLMGTVTQVIDGDTLEVRLSSGPIRVRMHSIDAPERDQPYGREAAAELYAKVANRDVQLDVIEQDRYDRQVAVVLLNGVDVNAEMVREGHAWAYRDYMTDTDFCRREFEARQARRGIWSLPPGEQVAPWEWRNLGRGERFAPTDYSSSSEADCIKAAGITATREVPTPAAPRQSGCDIKGNISDNGRIYHVPGSPSYESTRIDESKGERWFCTPGEAQREGWRASR